MFCRYVVNGDWGCACDDCTGRTQLQKEIAAMQAELAEWRTGKRRVYWLRDPGEQPEETVFSYSANSLKHLRKWANSQDTIIRVTVGPRGNVRPWRRE